MGLTAEEREQLRATVDDRSSSRGQRLVLVVVLALALLTVAFATFIGMCDVSALWALLLPLASVAFFLVLVTPTIVALRHKRNVPLVEGADFATRRAVLRAIGSGHSTDLRIDDLVVDMRTQGAASTMTTSAVPQMIASGVVAPAVFLVDEVSVRVVLAVAAVANFVAGVMFLRRSRLLRRYRSGGPGPPAAVKGDDSDRRRSDGQLA
jgi:hypothetical protein